TSSKSCVSAPASAAPAQFRTTRTPGEMLNDYTVAIVPARSTGTVCALGMGRSAGRCHFSAGCHVGTRAGARSRSCRRTGGRSRSHTGRLGRLFMNGVIYIKDVAGAAATKDAPAVEAVIGKVSVSHLGVTIPETVYAMFQLTFAIITPALICGAFAERMKFSAMLWFMAIWSIIVYAPIAHWMWEPGGWGAQAGVLDFAGGTVVHINSGIAALACALALGRRVGFNKDSMAPHNLVLTLIGASLLWVGWFGFNAG